MVLKAPKINRERWLQERWERDVIIRIVIALNEGQEIGSILKETPKNPSFPAMPGRLDLRGIDLSFQNLRGPWSFRKDQRLRMGINLSSADLSGASLNWVILPRADLRDALLINADLRNAELIFSDLSGADLTGADMQDAWLLDTRFYNSKVTEKQLTSRRNLGQLDFDYRAFEI